MLNGRELKKLLTMFKENRDEIEKRTGKRPDIDDTTKLYMQKVLNVWLSEGKDIDDEKFWNAVDHNKQFDYPVEYYEKAKKKLDNIFRLGRMLDQIPVFVFQIKNLSLQFADFYDFVWPVKLQAAQVMLQFIKQCVLVFSFCHENLTNGSIYTK